MRQRHENCKLYVESNRCFEFLPICFLILLPLAVQASLKVLQYCSNVRCQCSNNEGTQSKT